MKQPEISIIAAIGKNRELGKDNKLLWSLPEDMARFKLLTKNHAVIMGQKTYESIGKALPERFNIVLSNDQNFHPSDSVVVGSIDEALRVAKENEEKEVFVIGGGQVYKQFMQYADRLYLTLIDAVAEADTYFPEFESFKITKQTGSGESGGVGYKFLELTRDV